MGPVGGLAASQTAGATWWSLGGSLLSLISCCLQNPLSRSPLFSAMLASCHRATNSGVEGELSFLFRAGAGFDTFRSADTADRPHSRVGRLNLVRCPGPAAAKANAYPAVKRRLREPTLDEQVEADGRMHGCRTRTNQMVAGTLLPWHAWTNGEQLVCRRLTITCLAASAGAC
jgi:hypothetical protein